MWKGTSDSQSFYAIRPECSDDVPKTRFKPRSGRTLSARRWHASFSQEGHLDIAKVLSRTQRGGVHPSIRGEVWEFLLGCFDPKSTYEERNQLRQQRREQYGRWKKECQDLDAVIGSGKVITTPIITEDGYPIQDLVGEKPDKAVPVNLQRGDNYTLDDSQDEKFEGVNSKAAADGFVNMDVSISDAPLNKKIIRWKLTLHQIGLDVVRTDRTLLFYENQENLARLWDILSVYSWIDEDIGYCQGMSDLCSPMVILLENEADAFWCFEHLMRKLRGNFRCTVSSIGVQSQLDKLASVIRTLDPKLHQHLEMLDGGNYLFAFRMLMVLFRREFSFGDSLFLWELMWALEYDPNLFSSYKVLGSAALNSGLAKGKDKMKQYGKFERENMKNGKNKESPPISVFVVAGVLKAKSSRLLKEASGLDDVVKILNDITGKLDAKKACKDAMNLHKKYLKANKS
ncbi:TBC1 domain family member 15 isoform X2 [Amborella trichopoda]|uniref:Rab-GAP TBC domain-containing protein n=1 Tax=Amborella trichopoda TaxID=13333 RepID=U5DBK0_AMBTC|nr:TBC1 domain family member 15 isoform X2 [Amborella trichopoda]ERN18812.1 hypothetical protein AMTR_s00067p00097840 [Amborella trichopoda]|eukprot:XP_006857345.1 TBC1 domain family member 15 isoform X2 [Amborella trichopoda]